MTFSSHVLLCLEKPLQCGHAQQEEQGPSCLKAPFLSMLYLISRSHQQSPKSPDSSCNDPIHSVIQGEAQQEEETSIQKEV